MYKYRRYLDALGATDLDANAGGGGFGLPPAGGVGTGIEGPFYMFRFYKYRLDMIAPNGGAGAILLVPRLCWVTSAGAFVDLIEQDLAVVNPLAGGAYGQYSFDHDYGTEGLAVYRPANDLNAYFIGLIQQSTALVTPHIGISIDYGIDIDYRKLTKPVPTV